MSEELITVSGLGVFAIILWLVIIYLLNLVADPTHKQLATQALQTTTIIVGGLFIAYEYLNTQSSQRVSRTIDLYRVYISNPMHEQNIVLDQAFAVAIRQVIEGVLPELVANQRIPVTDQRIRAIFKNRIFDDFKVTSALSANSSFMRSVRVCVEEGGCDRRMAIHLFKPSASDLVDNTLPIRVELWNSGQRGIDEPWCWFVHDGRLPKTLSAETQCPRQQNHSSQ